MLETPEPEFLNRELSWLRFNDRVLSLAANPTVPLLERVNFLSIFSSNLDEFIMKRIGGLKRHVAAGVNQPSLDGLEPGERLALMRSAILPLTKKAESVFFKQLLPELEAAGVKFLRWKELKKADKEFCLDFYRKSVFPVLTPMAVDAAHPFPLISNLSTSLGVMVKSPESEDHLFARVKVSGLVPQWLRLPDKEDEYRFILVREIIHKNVQDLFPSMEIVSRMPFRITRNADIEIDEEEIDNLRELIAEELRQQRFARVVRLEYDGKAKEEILDFLMDELSLTEDDVYEREALIDFSGLGVLQDLPIPESHYPSWVPIVPSAFREEGSIFSVIRNRDVLVHHPYESFASSVERFVREAAEDPEVLSIKMTVYRVGDQTPIIPLLIKAAEMGKQVIVLVELKARFEEERNIQWARKLEEAGVHVVYGIPGLKIHAKNLLVLRKESDRIRCYAHVGTGNYHSKTANLYTDLGLFTCKEEYTRDLLDLFNYLTGRSLKDDYEKVLVAPVNMERTFLSRIEKEIAAARAGQPAHIVAKMNGFDDRHIIRALYDASNAGVKIDLIVRGICCLRPGVPGMSENIRVVSILGRLLEHSRVYYFRGGAEESIDGEFYIGSADWMGRNLHRRVELIVPVEERPLRETIWELLTLCLAEKTHCWEMQTDGSYRLKTSSDVQGATELQSTMMQLTKEREALFAGQ